MLRDHKDIIEYIAKNYSKDQKIIEIGVGHFPIIALKLREELPTAKILVTDINKETLQKIKTENVIVALDDVFKPSLTLYQDAALIYSIRPPPDLHPALTALAKKVGADLLVRPIPTESISLKKAKLVNYKSTTFYLVKNQ